MAERIAELRVEHSGLGEADPQAVISALPRIAKASETLATPAGVKEGRLTLLEACRPDAEMARERAIERRASGFFSNGN